jgi:uncharacterized protein
MVFVLDSELLSCKMEMTPNYFRQRPPMNKKLPQRVYFKHIQKDLEKKMVFIGGPRQVGKTTLAISFLKKYIDGHPCYLNWDNEILRRKIQQGDWPKDEPLIIFDELHKKKGWQTFLKGFWDVWRNSQRYIVTGSARLDIFRRGGDSMLGRYHYHRIHPYSLPELGFTEANLMRLFNYGGFPEPLLEMNENELRRWHYQRISKLVRIDLRDLENIQDLDKVELLADSLHTRVASPLSYRSIAEDLEKSDKTIKNWIKTLEMLYFCFTIAPFGSNKIKAIKKATKLYLWDWSQVEDEGARFENLVASHLLKLCHFSEDTLGHRMELRYLRDETGKECDFVVIKNRKPIFAIECKFKDDNLDKNIPYFKDRLSIPKWYQVYFKDGKSRSITPELKILSFEELCRELNFI